MNANQIEYLDTATIQYILAKITERSICARVENLPTDDEVELGQTDGREDPDMATVLLLQRDRAMKRVEELLKDITPQQKNDADLFLSTFDETTSPEVIQHMRSKLGE